MPPRVGPTRPRRRPALVALGVVLAVLGALTAVVLVGSAGQRTAVLALARDVPFGAVVTDADLTRVQVSVDPGVATVPAADLSRVVGQVAASDLHTGQLLTPDALTSAAPPAAGQVLVGVALPAERMPAGSLQPGDEVLVVDTPAAGADPPSTPPASIQATVVRVGAADVNGVSVVDVTVAAGDGPALAARAATGRIAVVLQPRGASR